ncbi:hypothetical protein B0H14DRAFT_2607560 [Mycena olivaceomarginata]|nr:hypothetical protein B0H14DRAFT_2607560 [Mycena olivaceomarginata]
MGSRFTDRLSKASLKQLLDVAQAFGVPIESKPTLKVLQKSIKSHLLANKHLSANPVYGPPHTVAERNVYRTEDHSVPVRVKDPWPCTVPLMQWIYDKTPFTMIPICVSVVNTVTSSLQLVTSVTNTQSVNVPYITGIHLSEEFDRVVGVCGMVFHKTEMHAKLNTESITFGTKCTTINKLDNIKLKYIQQMSSTKI